MAGGYAPDPEDIVAIHLRTVKIAAELATARAVPMVMHAPAG
jgi:hypothetical protein